MIRGRYSLVVALPKGRNFSDGYAALSQAGLELPSVGDGRALLHGEEGGVALLELRNHDVPTYVDIGIADVGIVGKDVLLESGRDVYEPVDLRLQPCRLCLIRRPDDTQPIRRLATKYPQFTAQYLRQQGLHADILPLSGNVELAVLTGLADAVVDVVQTGSTLKANGLVALETWAHSSARLIVNRQSLKLKREVLRPLIARLREAASQRSSAT